MRNKRDVRIRTLYTETISESTQNRTDEILVRLLIPWNTWKTEDLSSSRAAFVFPDLCEYSISQLPQASVSKRGEVRSH